MPSLCGVKGSTRRRRTCEARRPEVTRTELYPRHCACPKLVGNEYRISSDLERQAAKSQQIIVGRGTGMESESLPHSKTSKRSTGERQCSTENPTRQTTPLLPSSPATINTFLNPYPQCSVARPAQASCCDATCSTKGTVSAHASAAALHQRRLLGTLLIIALSEHSEEQVQPEHHLSNQVGQHSHARLDVDVESLKPLLAEHPDSRVDEG